MFLSGGAHHERHAQLFRFPHHHHRGGLRHVREHRPQTRGQPEYFQGAPGPHPSVEIKIDHDPSRDKPGEGEGFRGRHVMMGYMHSPEKTAEAIDADEASPGRRRKVDPITGPSPSPAASRSSSSPRRREHRPVPVEETLKSLLPGISNVMMIGDKRKYNTCLITLRQEQIRTRRWLLPRRRHLPRGVQDRQDRVRCAEGCC